MSQSTTLYVGLDVHKDSIDIALAEPSRDAEVRHLSTVAAGSEAVTKALRRLVSAGHRLHIVYEAGPCGFALQRHLSALGWRCDVVAPSSIPRPSGERVKTDRRDAVKHRLAARVSPSIARRQSDLELPKAVTDIAWNAQTRLCSRFRRLSARRLPHNKIVVAVARELCGFVWAIARQVTPEPSLPQATTEASHHRPGKGGPATQYQSSCRIGNATQPRPQGNPRKRY